MKEDEIIERRYGKECGFKVPDGYFERFECDLIKRISHKQTKKKSYSSAFIRLLAAACFLVAVVLSGVFFFDKDSKTVHDSSVKQMTEASSASSDYIIDQMYDYAMFDNDDFYSYATHE